ncbi:MAG: hypothetical protein PUC32_06665 [Oscillospiraceae bacterium]|nr:hypothetical protein [Oscillospiraceae bacterium]
MKNVWKVLLLCTGIGAAIVVADRVLAHHMAHKRCASTGEASDGACCTESGCPVMGALDRICRKLCPRKDQA